MYVGGPVEYLVKVRSEVAKLADILDEERSDASIKVAIPHLSEPRSIVSQIVSQSIRPSKSYHVYRAHQSLVCKTLVRGHAG